MLRFQYPKIIRNALDLFYCSSTVSDSKSKFAPWTFLLLTFC